MSFRDRKDGKRITNLDGMHGLIPHVMPKRCDADVYINQKFDVTNLVKYVEKIESLTSMRFSQHLVN